jgi:hypothetical protein
MPDDLPIDRLMAAIFPSRLQRLFDRAAGWSWRRAEAAARRRHWWAEKNWDTIGNQLDRAEWRLNRIRARGVNTWRRVKRW